MNKIFFAESDKDMLSRLRREFSGLFNSGENIAIKLHMGETYNPNHLQPDFVKKVVKLLTSMNTKPFLFDSPTFYGGPRHTTEGYLKQAAGMGFTEAGVGCPVVVSDDYVESKGIHMTYQVCRHLTEANGVVVLSHFKGHACAAMGGAIKNIGMGALTGKSKGDIHRGGQPLMREGTRCSLCKKCLEMCPFNAIRYEENGPVFDYASCFGCSKCIANCPSECLKPRLASFDELLADGSVSAAKMFKKTYYVNVLRRIANVCDCAGNDLRIVCPDIGVLMGRDPCAIDRASVEMVNARMGKDVFLELWHKSPLGQVEEAEKLGVGSAEYEVEDA